MNTPLLPESREAQAELYGLYRDYFDRAERKRRWNLQFDIPWDQCNRSLDPALADIVWTFCAVEFYLPDYLSKLIPQVRAVRGRAWMLANWGYEESKHSLALGDWLLKSGQRSEEQMADLEGQVFAHEWNLPYENGRAMVCYTMVQELATALHYRNLLKLVDDAGGDPALETLLKLIAVDECAHADFFRKLVALYLKYDREGTLEQLRWVMNSFEMPAIHMLIDGRSRIQTVRELGIFDDRTFYYDVFEPIIKKLGLTRADLRKRNRREAVLVNSPIRV
jgi:acyl-[acyl-carrier-protein] desaturase